MSHSRAPCSIGTYSSQPRSPTYEIRDASTRTGPISIVLQVANGKPSCETSSLVTRGEDVARARPPEAERRPRGREVGELRRAVRREVVGEPLVVRHPVRAAGDDAEVLVAEPHDREVGLEAAARREPRRVDDATDRRRRPVASRPSAARASAPGPETSKIANAERSKIPARSRIARCSALMIGDHQRASHSASRRPTRSPYSSSSGAFDSYHCGRSQPAASKKTAPSSCSRSWKGESRTSRFEAHCSSGWTMPYVLLKPSAVRAFTCVDVFWCSQKRAASEEWRSMCDSPCTIHSASDLPDAGPLLHPDRRRRPEALHLGKLAEDRHPVGGEREDPVDRVLDPDGLVADDRRHQLERLLHLEREVLLRERELGGRERGLLAPKAGPRGRTGSRGGRTSRSRGRCPSWRSYMFVSMSRTIGNSMPSVVSANRGVGPMSIIWCTAGVSGIDAPAMRASFGLQTPQAMTTTSASMSPRGRAHARARVRPRRRCRAPRCSRRPRAGPTPGPRSRMIVPARRESTTPTDGV